MGYVTHQSTWTDVYQLKNKLAILGNVDVIHVHTTCNNAELVSHVTDGLSSGIPIVWDMHDWTPNADAILPHCNGVIVPSRGYAENLNAKAHVVYSMLPKDWIQPARPQRVNAGILESGIEGPDGMVWRDYTEAQKKLCHPLYIYAGIDLCVDGAHPLNAHYDNLLQVAPYMGMMRQLSKYAFGYAGAANSRHSIHDCVTNKFWEYISAGIPVVTYNSSEMADLMRDLWTGVNLETLDEPFELPPRTNRRIPTLDPNTITKAYKDLR
jgi:hypothetical protein